MADRSSARLADQRIAAAAATARETSRAEEARRAQHADDLFTEIIRRDFCFSSATSQLNLTRFPPLKPLNHSGLR